VANKQITYEFEDSTRGVPRYVVYAFSDPRTNEVRYIGKTAGSLHRRVKRHLAANSLKEPTHKNNWLRNLLTTGTRPVIDVLETCAAAEDLLEAERFHIAYWRAIGARLTNGTDGGDGLMAGARRPRSVCEQISRSHKKRLDQPEALARLVSHIKAVAVSRRGAKLSDATKAQMSAAHTRRPRKPWSEEHRRAISRGKGGRSVVDGAGTIYATAKIAAQTLGLNPGCISQVLSGRNRHTGGHTFRYVDDVPSAIAIAVK